MKAEEPPPAASNESPLPSPKTARRNRALQEIRLCGLPRRVRFATAAAMLDVSETKLRDLVREGTLPELVTWPDGFSGFRLAELEAFIRGTTAEAAASAQSPAALRRKTRGPSQVV